MELIIIILLLTGLIVWISTGKIYQPPHGEWSAITMFKKVQKVYGPGIENQEWGIIKDDQDKEVDVKINLSPSQQTSWVITLWPQKIFTFPYKYARFMTYAEAKAKNRTLAWQPKQRKEDHEQNKQLPNYSVVLAENAEQNKQSLKVFEREEFEIDFISEDGMKGIKQCYVEFIVYDFVKAVTNVVSFKTDAINHISNLFYKWASEQKFEAIQRITYDSFTKIVPRKGLDVKDDINAQIVRNGVIVRTIYFMETILHPDSLDVIEELEGVKKDKISQDRAEEQGKAKVITATKAAAVTKITADANAGKIKIEGTATNEVAVDFLQKQKDIQVATTGKIIDKVQDFIKTTAAIEDVTTIQVADNLSRLKGVLVMDNGPEGTSRKAKDLVNEIIGHAIHQNREEVKDEN